MWSLILLSCVEQQFDVPIPIIYNYRNIKRREEELPDYIGLAMRDDQDHTLRRMIDRYAYEHEMSRSEAMRHLIRLGLESQTKSDAHEKE